jgi:hypothetical protein
MRIATFLLAAGALLLAACTMTSAAPASDTRLQDAASLMVSITQHGEGMSADDINDLASQLDAQVAGGPDDPFVLKLAAQSRRTLSDYSQDRAQRVHLRHTALAEYDRAIELAKSDQSSRIVTLNGQETEIDLKDLADLRAQLMHQVQADR